SAGPSALEFLLGVMGGWSLFENCTVDASICGQVFKGARWMPWHQEPMKDVGGHDRPRGVVNQALIRGCQNGETRQSSWAVTLRSEEHTSELQSRENLVCRLLLEKKKTKKQPD